MLSQQSLEAVLPLAEVMDRNSVIVTPVTGTPLDQLVNATRSGPQFAIPVDGKAGQFNPDIFNIGYMANQPSQATGVCEHDVAQDNIVEMAARGVRGHLMVIRSAVIPAIIELHDAVEKQMDSMPTSKILGMEVKIFDLPAPMKSPAIEGLISKWQGVPFASPALRMKCPDMSMEDIRELMKTGASGFDADVDKWIAIKGDSFFLQLWEDIFQTKNSNFERFNQAVECREEGLDRSVAIFLIARKLVDEAPEGTRMSLPALRELAQQYRDQAAAKIQRGLDDWANVKKRKQLVKKVDGRCILVNECVYRPWIADGGDNDVLFGNLVKQTNYTSVDQFKNAAGELKTAWNRTVATSGTAEKSERFLLLKQMLLGEFRKSVSDLADLDGGPDASAAERVEVINRFRAELNTLREIDTLDRYQLCVKLVCRSRFFKIPDAEDFVLQMMKIEKDNPNITAREAATIATIDYIACWVAEMFRVSAVGAR